VTASKSPVTQAPLLACGHVYTSASQDTAPAAGCSLSSGMSSWETLSKSVPNPENQVA